MEPGKTVFISFHGVKSCSTRAAGIYKIQRMLQIVARIEVVLCWIAWLLAFVGARKRAAGQKKVVRAPASKWGIILQAVGFALVGAYVRPAGFEKSGASLIASMILAPLSAALAWKAAGHLGKQWRFEAALSEDHELIQTGPYRWLRHPIYASMLGMLLAVAGVWTWWPMFIAGLIVFLAGIEIRVRAEDRLLSERFQESFTVYRLRVRAYIPFIR
jgi:protein-S-isoprenylcysteine O-methyltransferase Ste14